MGARRGPEDLFFLYALFCCVPVLCVSPKTRRYRAQNFDRNFFLFFLGMGIVQGCIWLNSHFEGERTNDLRGKKEHLVGWIPPYTIRESAFHHLVVDFLGCG